MTQLPADPGSVNHHGAGSARVFGGVPGELVVFEWAGYDDPEFYPGYVEKYGAPPTFTFTFFAETLEAYQKLRSGFRPDLVHPCAHEATAWREAGLIEPIDTSRIAAWNDVDPALRNMAALSHDGQQYMLPIDWGATALTYNTEEVGPADAATLQSLADPRFEGRVAIPDSAGDAYSLAFLATGVKDWSKATDAEFRAASDFLRRVHGNLRTYWTDGEELAQLMASGEVLLAWAWTETVVTLQQHGYPVAMNRNTREGSATWVCGFVRMKGSTAADDQVYDFLNAWMTPESAEYLFTSSGYGHANAAAMAKIDPALLEKSGLGSLEKYSENTLWQVPVPPDLVEKLATEFEKIRAGF